MAGLNWCAISVKYTSVSEGLVWKEYIISQLFLYWLHAEMIFWIY